MRMGALAVCLLSLIACNNLTPEAENQPAVFTEAAEATGLRFTHDNGWSGRYYLPEIMGAGGALLDYDGDGDLDLYLCQGGSLTEPTGAGAPMDRLFRNDLTLNDAGQPSLRFTDVTEESGINAAGFGMGATVGDIDNDGDPDLYLANFGPNQLWRNNGDGTFSDVTGASGTDDPRWSVSATFFDYDGDGYLDLFVGNYVDFTVAAHKDCYSGQLDYCSPSAYNPVPDKLLRNRGDGTFEDVTDVAGMTAPYGSALGAVAADFNGDGRPDLYVANDGNPNQLWLNGGDSGFQENALLAGCALNHGGFAEAGMGVDAADFDGDGDMDLFMTHLTGETNTIYVNDGAGRFEDRTIDTGLGAASKPFTGFGVTWFDYDNDGLLDLLAVNGAVTNVAGVQDDPFPYRQKNQLFHNEGSGAFTEVETKTAGLDRSEVSRGALFGDIDNDGDSDVVVTNNRGPTRLLLNQVGQNARWLRLRVIDPALNREAIGALVEAKRSDGATLWRRVQRNAGYASSHDPRVILGLGATGAIYEIRVHWPNGQAERWPVSDHGRELVLRRGEGEAIER